MKKGGGIFHVGKGIEETMVSHYLQMQYQYDDEKENHLKGLFIFMV